MTVLDSTRFTRLDPSQAGLAPAPVAQCMAEFQGHLYVGTGRIGAGDLDSPARILRRLADGQWEVVLEAPTLEDGGFAPFADRQVPMAIHYIQRDDLARSAHQLDSAYVSMAVFQGTDDSAPALYVGTLSVGGGRLLRSVDGEIFTPVCEPGMGDPTVLGLTQLTVFDGRLHVAATGSVLDGIVDRQRAGSCLVHASDNPLARRWEPVMEPGFGDADNLAVTCLCVVQGHLYAGTANRERGFQLWRTEGSTGKLPSWERRITDGAYGFNLNPAVTALAEFDGALYVASGTDGVGYDDASDVGQAAVELVRLEPSGEWDLIVGRPRFTPTGLKVPLSMKGQGFDDPFNAGAWALNSWDGALYLGTTQWEAFRALELGEEVVGGYQLWASLDGVEWTAVLDEGGGNPACVGITAFLPAGGQLWATTANYAPLIDLMAQIGNRPAGPAAPKGFELLLGR